MVKMFDFIDGIVKESHSRNADYIKTYFHYFAIEYEIDEKKEYEIRFLKRNGISGSKSRLQIRDVKGNYFDFSDLDIVEILRDDKNKNVTEIFEEYLLDISSEKYEDSDIFYFRLINENGNSDRFLNNFVDCNMLKRLESKMTFLPKSQSSVNSISFYLLVSMIIYKEQCFENISKNSYRKNNQAFIFYYLAENGVNSINTLSEKSELDTTKKRSVQISNLVGMNKNLFEIMNR